MDKDLHILLNEEVRIEEDKNPTKSSILILDICAGIPHSSLRLAKGTLRSQGYEGYVTMHRFNGYIDPIFLITALRVFAVGATPPVVPEPKCIRGGSTRRRRIPPSSLATSRRRLVAA